MWIFLGIPIFRHIITVGDYVAFLLLTVAESILTEGVIRKNE